VSSAYVSLDDRKFFILTSRVRRLLPARSKEPTGRLSRIRNR
jgi:hypothetical protein